MGSGLFSLLLVDDSARSASGLAAALRAHGHAVHCACSARQAARGAALSGLDAIIVARLPEGLSVAELLAARDDHDEVPLLPVADLPADAVVPALEARLGRAMAARVHPPMPHLAMADLAMDLATGAVARAGRAIPLTARETRLLAYLLRHPDEMITRQQLAEGVWDCHFDPGPGVIDVHLDHLARKLALDGEAPLLHRLGGAGYRLGP
jgi:two-component system OmpR family response regulator